MAVDFDPFPTFPMVAAILLQAIQIRFPGVAHLDVDQVAGEGDSMVDMVVEEAEEDVRVYFGREEEEVRVYIADADYP